MKFHFGHGIAAFYSIFALTMIMVVIKSTSYDNSLVAKDYYAQDIAYQSVMDRKSNSRTLKNPVSFSTAERTYRLSFPTEELGATVKGSIQLYCPSTADRDLHWPVVLTAEGKQQIPIQSLPAGKYKLIVNWNAGGEKYLDEFMFYHKG